MLKSEKARHVLMTVMFYVAALCLLGAGAVCVAAGDDPYFFGGAEFEARTRSNYLLAYAMSSVGAALLIGIRCMARVEQQAAHERDEAQSRASST